MEASSGPNKLGARRRWNVAGLVAVVAIGGLWGLSARSVSPEQRISDAEPPPAATVELTVERRRLSDAVLIRGRVAVRERIEVSAPGAGGGGEGAPTVAIVGGLPLGIGQDVEPGAVVAVVSDRPVMVVPMTVPMHRSLSPDDEGPDVGRLQFALASLGYDVETDSRYGPVTQDAVERLYEDRGFAPQRTGSELDATVEGAEDRLDAAEAALRESGRAIDAAVASGDQPQVDAAVEARRVARSARDGAAADLDDARRLVGPVVALGELVGIARFPVVVSGLPSRVGAPADGTVVVLSPSDLVVEAPSDETRASLLQPGMSGTATIDGSDAELAVTLAEPGTSDDADVTSGAAPVLAFVPDEPIAAHHLGAAAMITVTLAATDQEVLAVPTGAVRSDADGTYLLVVDSDDETRRVRFRPGAGIGGWIEVVAPDGPLEPGDVVRAG